MRIDNIRLAPGESEKKLLDIAARRLHGAAYVRILRKSLDARDKREIRWIYSIEADRKPIADSAPSYPLVRRQPRSVVVVGSGGKIADIALENGDVIVIPEKTDVVMISGEVIMPQAVVWNEDRDMDDYIRSAGGFSNRADTSNILVVHPDGEVTPKAKNVHPGDQILVLPRVDSKNMQAVKEVSQILYQVAVACKVILDL